MIEFIIEKMHDGQLMAMILAAVAAGVTVFTLAMPLLAGPGSIATVMVLMSRGTGILTAVPVVISIVLTFVASYYTLRGAHIVLRALGESGVAILQRLMGLILAAIAVQFIAEGSLQLMKHP